MTTAAQKRGMANEQRNAASLRDQTGGGARSVHIGVFARIHSEAPPPVEEYETWLALQLAGTRGVKPNEITGAKLRRAVVMRRNGCGYREIGQSLARSGHNVKAWLERLPEGLRA